MPIFLSPEEFEALKMSGDVSAVVEKADAFIRGLHADLKSVEATAGTRMAHECSNISPEYSSLKSCSSQPESHVSEAASDLAQVRSESHQLVPSKIDNDGEINLMKKVEEVQKSKSLLVDLVGKKEAEISDTCCIIDSYLRMVIDLRDCFAETETRLRTVEEELVRCKANCDKMAQLRHNAEKLNNCLNDKLMEATTKWQRRTAEIEDEFLLADTEEQYMNCSTFLSSETEKVGQLQKKLASMHLELCRTKDRASTAEQRCSEEICCLSKSSDHHESASKRWSKEAMDLVDFVKGLKTQMVQDENKFKEKLDKEAASGKKVEENCLELKNELSKCEAEVKVKVKKELQELTAAVKGVAAAEAEAAGPGARCSDCERNLKSSEVAVPEKEPASIPEAMGHLAKENQEVQALEDHMVQSKNIAEVNTSAMQHIAGANENFRVETGCLKNSHEAEIKSLRTRVLELENESSLKAEEAAHAASQIAALELQVTLLKEKLEMVYLQNCETQTSHERQVTGLSTTNEALKSSLDFLASTMFEASALQKRFGVYRSENQNLRAMLELHSDIARSNNENQMKFITELMELLESFSEDWKSRTSEEDSPLKDEESLMKDEWTLFECNDVVNRSDLAAPPRKRFKGSEAVQENEEAEMAEDIEGSDESTEGEQSGDQS